MMEDLARPVKASMKSAESLCDQSRERRLAARRRNAASYDAQAAPLNVRLARTMDRMYSVALKDLLCKLGGDEREDSGTKLDSPHLNGSQVADYCSILHNW